MNITTLMLSEHWHYIWPCFLITMIALIWLALAAYKANDLAMQQLNKFYALLTEQSESQVKVSKQLGCYTHQISSCDAEQAQESSGAYCVVCEQRTKLATKSRLEGRLV